MYHLTVVRNHPFPPQPITGQYLVTWLKKNFYFIMETSEEAIDLKTGKEFHLCISGKAKDLSIFFFIISFCPALSKRALDQYFEMSVCVSPISRPLIGRAAGFRQWFWHPTYPTRCSELGWAVSHSDFLAWLSSATLEIFILGVSSQILMP